MRVEQLEDRLAPSAAAAAAGEQFLATMQDEFSTRLPVSDDVSSAGNHFVAQAFLPDQSAPVSVDGSWTDNPHSGATAIRDELSVVPGHPFGGVYFQNGLLGPNGETLPNFGDTPAAGVSIPAATRLTFWARGQTGGEQVEFFAFGVGRNPTTGAPNNPYPDSAPRTPAAGTLTTLTAGWQQYSIDLTGVDTSYVLGGFGWVAAVANNPAGAVFFLDDIQYDLTPAGAQTREDAPRFIRSYLTGPDQSQPAPVNDFDFVLRNSAFSYDNAVSTLALLADRDPATQADSLRRAELIGDAFVYAAANDRRYTDGRVRTDYSAGDLTVPPGWVVNGKLGTPAVAGFYDDAQQRFFEILQTNVDTGNNAWVMIALLGLYSRTGSPAYLTAARQIGNFILTLRNDTGLYQGFLGGINNADSATQSPTPRQYASTEHNIDVYAAFTRMFQLTGETTWQDGATHAWQFVEAMWDPTRGAFLAGTTDPNTRNTNAGQLPLDVQVWSVLARPDVLLAHPTLLADVDQTFRVTEGGITGYDFNDDRDGVWSEGTAQTTVAFAVAGDFARVQDLRHQLDQIRLTATAPGADQLGMPAALHDGLTTGFQTEEGQPFLYFNRLHIGATAWNVFAQLGFNPYYQTFVADSAGTVLATGGPANGAAAGFFPDPNARYPAAPTATVSPFGNTGTDVRTAVADVNGDATPDLILVTGPGTPIRVAVVSGADYTTVLVPPFDPFGGNFGGGGFVAAGDFEHTGRAEFVVTPDQGGGPRVSVFALTPTGLATRANFFGIDDPNFRGGARAAAGDVNHDGTPDLTVAAGFGGGPRVAVFDGTSLFTTPTRLVNDFFAFPGADAVSLRNGTFVASGDLTGDGFADLIFGGGPGGAPRVFVLSGALVSAGNVAGAQAAPVANFFVAGNTADRGGVRVAAVNTDGDATADLAVGSGQGSPARVRVYLGKNFTGSDEPGTFQDLSVFGGAALADGVYVG